MKAPIKKLWVKALRSGKYRKGKGQLKDRQSRFCCLGVLCDLYAREKGKRYEELFTPSEVYLPTVVSKWAGFRGGYKDNPRVPYKNENGDGNIPLACINDKYEKGFKVIANLIQKHL